MNVCSGVVYVVCMYVVVYLFFAAIDCSRSLSSPRGTKRLTEKRTHGGGSRDKTRTAGRVNPCSHALCMCSQY